MPLLTDLEPQKEARTVVLGNEKESEAESLLPPRNGGISKEPTKTRRKVHWKDTYGNKLAEILEFQPSDGSDSDEDDSEPCLCTIM